MSWLQRLSTESSSKTDEKENLRSNEERMGPGLTGEYDKDLREKAGMHIPPPPPECMGLEGEYDPSGLAKRVAVALDRDPDVEDLETLSIIQTGGTISFQGQVPNQSSLEHIIELTRKVDGTKAVDSTQVIVEGN